MNSASIRRWHNGFNRHGGNFGCTRLYNTHFLDKTEAADYLNAEIHGQTVGFGGSMTLEELRLWERLSTHNTVYSHLHGYSLGPEAANVAVYISSVNGIAETGEIYLD